MKFRLKPTKEDGKALIGYTILPFVVAVIVLFMAGAITNQVVGCEGISYYYHNTNFYEDWHYLMKNLTNSGLINFTNWNLRTYPIIPPKLINETKYDCKTISNAIYCLAQRYGMRCKFQNTIDFYSDFTFSGHLGVWCFDDDFNSWERLY